MLNDRPHKRLDVWQKSMDLVPRVYKIVEAFPALERFGLADQMRRAAVSIPSNIAEGAARQTRKEFVNYLHMAQGSLSELETQLELAIRLRYVDAALPEGLEALFSDVGRLLSGLIRSLRGQDRKGKLS